LKLKKTKKLSLLGKYIKKQKTKKPHWAGFFPTLVREAHLEVQMDYPVWRNVDGLHGLRGLPRHGRQPRPLLLLHKKGTSFRLLGLKTNSLLSKWTKLTKGCKQCYKKFSEYIQQPSSN
jgi:hypothetical protein